ncbi:uncharacterized protein SPPG_05331 [Spizellomyces punctatus DAOM BR117]|uniref:L-type lectin-like domain-containing protein n=1 Tax=Spizellomyces punctatus (strain DAOM BR117) TaxID=645134 RepID=A0A0L0HGC2_SPIPD|nr:uncharacterized protein SPPG_05331 [Spizellomyces punctatus DAOM BR117]KNC99959.1 hypothetical protein SPPG_05331 [Spizellomyces punctatus DAOM BR117]|eukprot:XP_016607999.1 hypothetical protein SPPG_05331 [Spizellomyces punctatus DAOM BR117]
MKALILGVLSILVCGVSSQESSSEQYFTLFSWCLAPPYIEENLQNRWWNFGGDALMEVNRFVRLTPELPSKSGWLWSKQPFTSSSWLVEFDFKVHGASSGLHGDGFAFWYTTDKEQGGPVYGSKDQFTGLGVFFDTYANGRHKFSFPYVNAMIGDGKTKYDHANDGVTNQIGGCSVDFRQKDVATKARIKYYKDDMVEVSLNYKGDDTWEQCFTKYNVSLPTHGYLGFSAFTGDVSDNHDIITITTKGITNPSHSRPEHSQQNLVNKSSGGAWHYFTILLSLTIFAVVCYGIWVVLRMREERSFKRF